MVGNHAQLLARRRREAAENQDSESMNSSNMVLAYFPVYMAMSEFWPATHVEYEASLYAVTRRDEFGEWFYMADSNSWFNPGVMEYGIQAQDNLLARYPALSNEFRPCACICMETDVVQEFALSSKGKGKGQFRGAPLGPCECPRCYPCMDFAVVMAKESYFWSVERRSFEQVPSTHLCLGCWFGTNNFTQERENYRFNENSRRYRNMRVGMYSGPDIPRS